MTSMLIIDIQEKLLNAVFNTYNVRTNSEILAKAAELLELPVFITEQYPKGLGSTVIPVIGKVYEKTAFNAIEDIKLLQDLKNSSNKKVIVFGIETHICVHQTVTGLIENGFEVTVISDACGSRFQEHYEAGLECMKANGAQIKPTEMVLFELLKSSKHPKFKEIQSLIK